MDITEKKNISELDDNMKNIINLLGFKYDKIKIIGSSVLKSIKYFNDYDLAVDINYNYSNKEIYDEIKGILRNIFDNPNLYFIELKIQTINNKKYRWFVGDTIKYDDFVNKLKDVKFIKLDLIIYKDYEFIPISVNYIFKKDIDKNKIIEDLYDDINKLKKEKKYFKILKRVFSISKINNNVNNLLYLAKVFNSELGKKYKIISVIDTILDLLKHYKKESLVKKKIEIVLDNYKLPHNLSMLEKYKTKLDNEINTEGLKIYKLIKY